MKKAAPDFLSVRRQSLRESLKCKRRNGDTIYVSRFFDNFVYFGTFLYLLANTVEGALRFVLVAAGVETLLYLRDLFIVITVLWFLIAGRRAGAPFKPLATLLVIIAVWGGVALIYVRDIGQILFGIKMFAPLMLGIIATPLVFARRRASSNLILLLWSIALSGLLLSAVVRMPWVGLTYQIGDAQIQGNRAWHIGGIERLAGLSRSSIAVSIQILWFAIFIASFAKSKPLRFAVWLVSGLAIVLTTSRTTLIAHLAVTGFLVAQSLWPALQRVWKSSVLLAAAIMVLLPLMPIECFAFMERLSQGGIGGTSSFLERIESTWPDAFKLLRTYGNSIVGRGIGGIGGPQRIFEQDLYSPGDNLFIYLFVLFGVFSIYILFCITVRLNRLNVRTGPKSFYIFCVGLASFSAGGTENCIEDPCISIFFGMLVAYVFTEDRVAAPKGNLSLMSF